MDRSRSGVFDLRGLKIGGAGKSMNDPSLPGASGQGEKFHTKKLPISGMEPSKSTKPTHIARNAAGEETPIYGLDSPSAQSVKGKKGWSVSEIGSGKVIKKEHESIASSVAAELAESWWCGTPEVMEKERKKAPPATTRQPDRAGNWSVNAVDKPVTEASDKVKKASKPKQPKAGKPNRVPDAKNEDPAMAHAKKIMKMANCVAGSVHASPLGILAAEYAKHTFHPSNIGEASEAIVDKFIEDTMTGDVASMALGFAPTGEMDPHEGRPGKKKKKKNQFDKLASQESGGMFGKLARKVSGGMPT